MKVKRVLFIGAGTSSFIASKADSTMTHIEMMWKGEEVKAINPSVECLLYRNIRAVKERYPDEYQTFLNNDWILKDASGARIRSIDFPENWIVDVGNPAVQEWIANWFVTNLGIYDGAYLDNCLPSTEILWNVSSKPAINPRTGQEYTADEFRDDVISLVNMVKSAITPKIVMGNGITTGTKFFQDFRYPYYSALLLNSQIDAIMCEAWLLPHITPIDWRTESEWKDGIDFVIWLETNFIPRGKYFYPIVRNSLDWYNNVLLPPGCTQEQCVFFAFATLLLGASTSDAYYLNFGHYNSSYLDKLFALDVGSPLSPYYVIPGTRVYARDFTKVKTLVNPTSESYIIFLDKDYATIDGEPVGSSVTMNAHTGAILVSTYLLTITASNYGTTDPPPETYTYQENQVASVTAIPNAGYLFDHWTLNGETYTDNPLSIIMTTDATLTPIFVAAPPPPPQKHILTITAGAGGTTDPPPASYEIEENTEYVVKAVPEIGYKFKSWLLDGAEYAVNPIIVLMDADHSLYASFIPPMPPERFPEWLLPLGIGMVSLLSRKGKT